MNVFLIKRLQISPIHTDRTSVNMIPLMKKCFCPWCCAISNGRTHSRWVVWGSGWTRGVAVVSPPGLLLFHEFFALLTSSLVDRVAWIIDLECVFVLHVGIFYLSALFIKVQNMGQPKSQGETEFSSKEQQSTAHRQINHQNQSGKFPVEKIRSERTSKSDEFANSLFHSIFKKA